MPSWNELLSDLDAQKTDEKKKSWLLGSQQKWLNEVARLRGNRNVLMYASAFLQKPAAPGSYLMLTHEELNGFMSVIYGMDWSKGLTLLLHTPGGVTNAAETIVEYLWTKFSYVEVIVPTYAMSAGTMVCLASDRIIMGRQSQLGPIDPQMPVGGRTVSARAIVDQFSHAKADILSNKDSAHVWAPALGSLGPALLQEAQNALEYGERMVAGWLEQRMFRGNPDPHNTAVAVANWFNSTEHRSHGRRIDRNLARAQGVVVEDLEDNQDLQDATLTAYHLATITFEKGPATKMLVSSHGRLWVKNLVADKSK